MGIYLLIAVNIKFTPWYKPIVLQWHRLSVSSGFCNQILLVKMERELE